MPTDRSSPSIMPNCNGAARRSENFLNPNMKSVRTCASPTSTSNEGSVTSVTERTPNHHMVATANSNQVHSRITADPYCGFTPQRQTYSAEHESVETSEHFGEVEPKSSSSYGLKKQRLKGSQYLAQEKDHEAVMQAAGALLMLWSNMDTCQSTSSSSARDDDVRGDPSFACGHNLFSQSGETSPEDATTASVLSRPCNKRRYRLLSDLLKSTPRMSL